MKQALGRGLDALIPAAAPKTEVPVGNSVRKIPVSKVKPNRLQPRREFSAEALQALAASIKAHGLAQPIVVSPEPGGSYELIAGERRLRASHIAGLTEIDAIVRTAPLSDTERLALALIENLQREDLNPIEEALGYQKLIDQHGMSQAQLADSVGKARPTVANTLRLLDLDGDIQASIRDGRISEGHGRALLGLPDAQRRTTWKRAINENWTVRQIERTATQAARPAPAPKEAPAAEVKDVEATLQQLLGTKVEIKSNKKNRGSVKIHFYSLDDFDRLLVFFKKAGL